MNTPTLRDRSRENWDGEKSIEHINSGSLQRIADAVEKIAVNYDSLVSAKNQAEKGRKFWMDCYKSNERKIRSLRGYITRLKKGGRK